MTAAHPRSCTSCKTTKGVDFFSRTQDVGTGILYWCRPCADLLQAKPKPAPKPHCTNKMLALMHYSGGRPACVCCQDTHFEFLLIGYAVGNKTKGNPPSYDWLIHHKFPVGYRVLCYNCDEAIQHKGFCPHHPLPPPPPPPPIRARYSGRVARYGAHRDVQLHDVVYVESDGRVSRASASEMRTSLAIGIVVKKLDAVTVMVLHEGELEWPTKVVPGKLFFLAKSPGGVTQEPPHSTGGVVHQLGIAVGCDKFVFTPTLQPLLLGSP